MRSIYLCAVIAVIISGLAKGGFAGVGAVAMPVMALVRRIDAALFHTVIYALMVLLGIKLLVDVLS